MNNNSSNSFERAINDVAKEYDVVVDPIERKRRRLHKILDQLAAIRESCAKETCEFGKTFDDVWPNFEKLPEEQKEHYRKLTRLASRLELELYPTGTHAQWLKKEKEEFGLT